MGSTVAEVADVRAFWNANPCGAQFTSAPFGTPEFYRQHADFRYRTEWHLNELVPWDAYRDRDVLEIGCGLGADGARWAQHGARYTGVDLTPVAVQATTQRLEILGLDGRVLVQNAEEVPDLADQSFDLVYSHGVLHHTPRFERALAQVHRVLRPEGRIFLMLYHRQSFNYYVRILGYLRARVLFYALTRSLGASAGALETHWLGLQKHGVSYLKADEFVNHSTDGAACPLARAYTREEISQILSPWFDQLEFKVAHFPIGKRFPAFPRALEGAIAKRVGWYLFIEGRKR